MSNIQGIPEKEVWISYHLDPESDHTDEVWIQEEDPKWSAPPVSPTPQTAGVIGLIISWAYIIDIELGKP